MLRANTTWSTLMPASSRDDHGDIGGDDDDQDDYDEDGGDDDPCQVLPGRL